MWFNAGRKIHALSGNGWINDMQARFDLLASCKLYAVMKWHDWGGEFPAPIRVSSAPRR
jgi:hypothetical protein